MKRSHVIYALLGVGLTWLLAHSFQLRLNVHPYVTWVAAASVVTWALYAWDKRMAELRQLFKGVGRVPEMVLNLMALIGGFPGAWVARSMFEHKIDRKKHPMILAMLIVSTVLHALLVVRLIYGPPLVLWPPENWLTF